MSFTLSGDCVSDVKRKCITKLTPKQIKHEVFKVDKSGLHGHLIFRNTYKSTTALISASHEGYFLVDAVTQALKREFSESFSPKDFIYIDSKGESFFVIMVSDGDVMIDKEISLSDYELPFVLCMIQESLITTTTSLIITAAVDINRLSDATVIDPEVFNEKALVSLIGIESVQKDSATKMLQPINLLAIKKKSSHKPMLALLSVFLLSGLWLFSAGEEEVEKPKKVINPYEKYNEILTVSGINSKTRFGYLYNDIIALNTLTGWEVLTIDLDAKISRITLKSNDGSYAELEAFSKKYQYIIQKVKDKYIAISQIKHSPILAEAVLVPPDSTLVYIEESGKDWLPNFNITNTSKPVSNQFWEEMTFSVNIADGWTKHDFDTLGTILNIHPIGFLNGKLAFNQNNNTYNGKLSFVIYGAKG